MWEGKGLCFSNFGEGKNDISHLFAITYSVFMFPKSSCDFVNNTFSLKNVWKQQDVTVKP